MKVISFSIYKDNPKLFNYYLRGLYFNMRMAKLLLPDWEIFVNIEKNTYLRNSNFFDDMGILKHLFFDGPRCANMMERFGPAYIPTVEAVLCRDADSCLTYREMLEIRKWEASGKDWHGINDNPAHSIEMMGGMIGLKPAALKRIFTSIEELRAGWDLNNHGSDQQLIMNKLWPKAQESFYHSKLTNREPQPAQNPLWESDLIQRYIGSAGVIEMELVRFLDRFDPQPKWLEFEYQYLKLFYWHSHE